LSLVFEIVLSVLFLWPLKLITLYREKRNALCMGTLPGTVRAHRWSGGVDGMSRALRY
jgi:hypothetical protein